MQNKEYKNCNGSIGSEEMGKCLEEIMTRNIETTEDKTSFPKSFIGGDPLTVGEQLIVIGFLVVTNIITLGLLIRSIQLTSII